MFSDLIVDGALENDMHLFPRATVNGKFANLAPAKRVVGSDPYTIVQWNVIWVNTSNNHIKLIMCVNTPIGVNLSTYFREKH